MENPCGTTRPTSHQPKHPKTSDLAENRAKYKIKRKEGEDHSSQQRKGPGETVPSLSATPAGRAEQMQPGISMAGRSPRALRHEALLFSCSARLSAPALPCPSLPALVGRTVGCGAASHRRQQRRGEKNGDRLTPSPRTLLD